MSVLIKGMEMPTNCWFCPVKSWDDDEYVCPFSGRTVKSGDANRHDDCPLIELPSHGDLIDRDSYKADLGITDWDCNKCQWGGVFGCKRDDFNDACFFLENAEVIIPAERNEDE